MAFKLRIRPQFPALVSATSPITLTKNGSTYTFGFDMSQAPTGPTGPPGAPGPSGAGYGGTSASSITIGSGTKVFTTQAGLAYQLGNYVRVSSSANGANFMEGYVVGYSGTTISINVANTGGAGTFTDWVFAISGTPGSVGVSTLNGQNGALALPVLPGGRLTLTSGTPVMTTSVAGATTVFYTAYAGSYVPIYDGTNFIPTVITGNEISLVTTDATKSPAAVGASSYYDVFVWSDSGTLRVSRGPAWTNATTRSAGTALVLVNGIYLNNASITNGPAASRGTYVGTIGSNGSSTIDYIFPAVSTNGTAGVFNVWNCYNRVDISGFVGMSVVQWTYAVANTWRQQNAQASYAISVLRGLNEDGVSLVLTTQCQPGASTNAACGIGLDSTTAASGRPTYVQSSVTQVLPMAAFYDGLPGLGFHTFSALELNTSTTASSSYGSGGTSYVQTGMSIRFRA